MKRRPPRWRNRREADERAASTVLKRAGIFPGETLLGCNELAPYGSWPKEEPPMPEGREHRRLAAILAADVVGYSRLMENDETGTLARLRMLRREIIDPSIAAHS